MLLRVHGAAGVGRVVDEHERRLVVDEALEVRQRDLPVSLGLAVGPLVVADQRPRSSSAVSAEARTVCPAVPPPTSRS